MTHEELLAKINEELATDYEDSCGNIPLGLNALRAVAELHKPETFNDGYKDVTVCEECNDHYLSLEENYYPCLTIKAIKKELK
jgi:hypothetical protein